MISSVPDPLQDFRSPWWLPGGHLQTVWRKLVSAPQLHRSRRRIELQDGDFIDLDFAAAHSTRSVNDPTPLVFLLHGLAGCSASPYIVAMQTLLQQNGYDSVAMNLRGCSGDFNRLAVAYHSGCSHDVEEVISALLPELTAARKLAVIGYSLGANVLIKWLSETPHRDRVLAAVSVSNPFELALCCGRMNSGVAYLYGRYFLNRLRMDLKSKQTEFEKRGRDDQLAVIRGLGSLDSIKTLWGFDDAVTAPLHGFNGARDYYDKCSSRQFLPAVTVPSLLIHGRNDPIIPPQAVPCQNELPSHIHCEVLKAGGHVGFAADGQPHWLERRILNFIELTQINQSCSVGGKSALS
ncbi:MAG: alpha/beta fold hydrolase [Pseudohongiella sp.]|nr:alpha/beta fold hydrolase [Pseudohongiella sp.]MDO9521121.1 alpha/beta fold hydrolase [Pseudohongiella sp.]